MLDKLWFAEYSKEQECFHIDNYAQIQKMNIAGFSKDSEDNDYKIFFAHTDQEECHKACEVMRKKLGLV